MTRDEIITRLAEAFGPHLAPVPRDTGDPRWDRGRTDLMPDGNDEQGSTMVVFRDTDGHNSMRPLTYGEIADVLASVQEQDAEMQAEGLAAADLDERPAT